jgi:Zn-dependent protease
MKNTREWRRLGRTAAFGAPVFVHWSVLVPVGLMAAFAISNPIYGALFLFSYLAVIVTHELGHAFVARRLGYHIDAIGIAAWHGWCVCDAPDSEWHEVLVAGGGVAAQLAVALPVLLVTLALGDCDWSYFTPIVVFLGYLNIVIAIVNLVPGDGSDGAVAWRLVPLLLQERRAKRIAGNRRSRRK